jgi:hypothetical protein
VKAPESAQAGAGEQGITAPPPLPPPLLKTEKSASEEGGSGNSKKLKKKKGVGYGSDQTGQNKNWNVEEFLKDKRQKSQALLNLLSIVESFLDVKGWQAPVKLLEQLCESALLPILESAFRSGSMLEMSKELELMRAYMRIAAALSKHTVLIPALLELDAAYEPRQTQSILTLLGQLAYTAKLFLIVTKQDVSPVVGSTSNSSSNNNNNTGSGGATSNVPQPPTDTSTSEARLANEAAVALAKEIVETHAAVSEACQRFMDSSDSENEGPEDEQAKL